MGPRRRRADSAPWWHARPGFLVALLFAPAVWIQIVSGLVHTFDRVGNLETELRAVRGDVARHEIELRELRRHHREP